MSRTLLVLAGAVAAISAPSPAHTQGQAKLQTPPSGKPATRRLVCHGGPGLQVRIHADPSPSWNGPASFPAKPVRMALRFAGGAAFSDAGNLAAGSCAWVDWSSALGVPPGEVFVDVNAASRPAPNPASLRADLADAKRFYRFQVSLTTEPLAHYEGEWIPGASSQSAGPATEPATAAGTDPLIRQLMCRGGPSGFEFRVIADPSPAYPDPPKHVRLAVRYRVHLASDTADLALGGMSPGTCGWDMQFGAPRPPGEVMIDIETDAQASNVSLGLPRDTSIRAGLSYPDTATLRRYLSDPRHFWTFFQADRGEPLSISHAPYEPDLTNLFVPVQKAPTTASGTSMGGRSGVAGSLRDRGPSTTRPGARATTTTGNAGGAPLRDPPNAAASPGIAARTISNLQVGPGPMGVRITFTAAAGWVNPANPVMPWISVQRPSWDEKTRQWSYSPGNTIVRAEARSLGGGKFVVEPERKLVQGRRYYYLIEVRGKDPSRYEQRTGSFTADIKTAIGDLFKPPGAP